MGGQDETFSRIKAITPSKLSLLSDFLLAAMGLALAGVFLYLDGGTKTILGFAVLPAIVGIISLARFAERLRFRSMLLRVLNGHSANKQPAV
jgi:hypothetical protein